MDYDQFWAGSFQAQGKTAQQIVRDLGYQLVLYKYTTEDGHINSVYRLISKKESGETIKKQLRETKKSGYNTFFTEESETDKEQLNVEQKPVVICQHGWQDSMIGYIINDKDSIGIRLVEAGFDVWLNNTRGNKYSKEHSFLDIEYPDHEKKRINPDIKRQREQFFNYSFHEMGLFDQPALWKKVMEVTGQDRIAYIGHSQGTTQMFVSMMAYPEFYRKHMKVFVALCPVAYLDHMKIEILLAFKSSKLAQQNLRDLGPEMGPEIQLNYLFSNIFAVSEISQEFMVSLFDRNTELVSQQALQNYSGHTPAGASTKSFFHFFQVNCSGKFQMYDYGTELNKKYYGGQETPPLYPWERLKDLKKVVMVCGKSDRLTEPEDYLKLKKHLEEQNALLEFMEIEHGHIGTTCPAAGQDKHLNYIINDLLKREDIMN